MREDLTVEECAELILSNLNLDGWKGEVCMGCRPKNDAPFPATVNITMDTETWECPRCKFVNVFTWRKVKPVHLYPDYGVEGSVIIKAYEMLGIEKNDLTSTLNCDTL